MARITPAPAFYSWLKEAVFLQPKFQGGACSTLSEFEMVLVWPVLPRAVYPSTFDEYFNRGLLEHGVRLLSELHMAQERDYAPTNF
jgi:hypothetical protein